MLNYHALSFHHPLRFVDVVSVQMLGLPLIFDDQARGAISAPHLDSKLLLGTEAEAVEDLLEDLEERGLPGVRLTIQHNSPLLLVYPP